MERSEIYQRIRTGLSKLLGVELKEVTEDAKFVEDFGVDSLDSVELLMSAEEEFKVIIHDDKMEKVHTVSDAVDMVEEALAEAQEKKRLEEEKAAKELAELGPARLAWAKLEESAASEYISRTGLPYFVYDGTPSRQDTPYADDYTGERDIAIGNGTLNDFLVKTTSFYLGKDVKGISRDTITDIMALTRSVDIESRFYSYTKGTRFSQGCHEIVLPNGQKIEMAQMRAILPRLRNDLLISSIQPFMKGKLNLLKTDKKGNTKKIKGDLIQVSNGPSWTLLFLMQQEGKGRLSETYVTANPYTGEWQSPDGKSHYEPCDRESMTAYGKINKFIRIHHEEYVKKWILERASFVLGYKTKSVTPALASRAMKMNRRCNHICTTGEFNGLVTLHDGRAVPAFDRLNPSGYLMAEILCYSFGKMQPCIELSVDGERGRFIAYSYIAICKKRKSVFLEGEFFTESYHKSESFEISLGGGKCRRVSGTGWNISYKKADVSVIQNRGNDKVLCGISDFLQKVFGNWETE